MGHAFGAAAEALASAVSTTLGAACGWEFMAQKDWCVVSIRHFFDKSKYLLTISSYSLVFVSLRILRLLPYPYD
jgi:hypothetical protein